MAKKKTASLTEESLEIEKKAEPAAEKPKKSAAKPAEQAEKKPAAKKPAAKRTKKPAVEAEPAEEKLPEIEVEIVEEPEVPAEEPVAEAQPEIETEIVEEESLPQPRRSVAFIGSECYPFVKTGGLGDVMYALPRALTKQNCDVKVILPRYKCIPWEYQQKMVYRGEFYMDLCSDGRKFYVGIMEYVWDGVVYDFIDNEEFFSAGNPYISLFGLSRAIYSASHYCNLDV